MGRATKTTDNLASEPPGTPGCLVSASRSPGGSPCSGNGQAGHRKTFKYRVYPNKAQAETLARWIEMCRVLYNAMLEERRAAYDGRRLRGKAHWVDFYSQRNQLPEIRRSFPEYASMPSHILANVAQRIEHAYRRFYDKTAKIPRFQGARHYESVTFPDSQGWKADRSGLHITHCGRIKVRWHRPLEGVPKTLTVKHRNGRWYVCFQCANVPAPQYPETEAAVGIDLGLEVLATTSDGQRFENAKFLRKNKKRLRRAQRHLSRQKRGSNRRKETVRQLQHLHERVANQRRDAHHKASTDLVRRYAMIGMEEISPQFMFKNRRLAFSASDVGWGQFTTFLQYKAAAAGRTVLTVNAAYTSQACSGCGVIVPKPLSERRHKCPECGLDLHRDHNAAINILKAAIGETTTARAELAVTVPAGAPDDPQTLLSGREATAVRGFREDVCR